LKGAQPRNAIQRGLGFSRPLSELFRAGVALRDSSDFPAKKYLLAHVARELRNGLHVHVYAYASARQGQLSKPQRAKISPEVAQRWVNEISPVVESFGKKTVPTVSSVPVPVDMVVDLDKVMRHEASVSAFLLDRMMEGLAHLQQFVPLDTLASAVRGLVKTNGGKYNHLRDPDKDFSESEVVALWDQLELLLFDLVGSAAWAYASVDRTIEELENL
jgi:hypothetical protein